MNKKTLGEIAQINPRFTGTISTDSMISFLPMASVSEEGKISSIEAKRGIEINTGYSYFESGDVIVAKITPCFENGKAALIEDIPGNMGFGSTEFHVIRPQISLLNPKYLLYFLRTQWFQAAGRERMTGSAGQKRVPADFLRTAPIPLPTVGQQKKIVHILDKMDEIRRKRREAANQTNALLFSVFFNMFGDPITNPKCWPKVLLNDLAVTPNGIKCGPFGTQLSKDDFVSTGVPLWGIKQVNKHFAIHTKEFLTHQKAQELSDYAIIPGDIIMTRKGTIGNCAVYPSTLANGIMHSDLLRIRTNPEKCISRFLSWQLAYSKDVERQIALFSSGAIMPGINVSKLKLIKVYCPPLSKQKEFVVISEKIMKLKDHQNVAIVESENLFNSLLQNAFQGSL